MSDGFDFTMIVSILSETPPELRESASQDSKDDSMAVSSGHHSDSLGACGLIFSILEKGLM